MELQQFEPMLLPMTCRAAPTMPASRNSSQRYGDNSITKAEFIAFAVDGFKAHARPSSTTCSHFPAFGNSGKNACFRYRPMLFSTRFEKSKRGIGREPLHHHSRSLPIVLADDCSLAKSCKTSLATRSNSGVIKRTVPIGAERTASC